MNVGHVVGLLAGMAAISGIANADTLLFDNMSLYEAGTPNVSVSATSSTPNTFMGGAYNLASGASSITGFDLYPVNLSGTGFNALRITIYVWDTVNMGTVNATTPAFSGLLASYTVTSTGSFNSGFFFPFEGSPNGVTPGLTLASALPISDNQIGLTFNYQGSTDGGATYNSVNSMTSLISVGTIEPTSVGSRVFDGYYRNANGEIDGNFTSSLRALSGASNQTLAVRIYGTVPAPASLGLLGFGGLLAARRRR
jgi:hypothetical protein